MKLLLCSHMCQVVLAYRWFYHKLIKLGNWSVCCVESNMAAKNEMHVAVQSDGIGKKKPIGSTMNILSNTAINIFMIKCNPSFT